MPLITPLFLALAELFTTRRCPKAVAEQWKITIPDLVAGISTIHHLFWPGRFALALQKPQERPDLIPLLAELSRLEDHYAGLMTQLGRAEFCAVEAAKFGADQLPLQMKANSVAFRIGQAATRVIRDMQKARIAFERAENPEAHPAPAQRTKSTKPTTDSTNQQDEIPVKKHHDLPTPDSKPPAPDQKIEVPIKKQYEPEPIDPLVQACLARNRHRIKNTPSKDRPALIEKLVAAERDKQTRTAA